MVYATLFMERRATVYIPPVKLPNIKDASRLKKLFTELTCELYGFVSTHVTIELIYEDNE